MEWSLRSIAKKCSLCGEPFNEGDRVLCVVARDPNGQIERFDVLQECVSKLPKEMTIVGFWSRVYSTNINELQAKKDRLTCQEEFFFSIFEGEETAEGELLKQLLALLLEKAKRLRALGRPEQGVQRFIHSETKREFMVPVRDFAPEEVSRIGNVLESLIG